MLALNVLRQYTKCHVLIVRASTQSTLSVTEVVDQRTSEDR